MPLARSGRGPILLGVAAVALATAACAAAEATDLQNVVRAYADAMIRAGRDTYGEEQSPLFAAGGTSGGCAAILDERIRAAVISGWVFSRRYTDPKEAKWCTVMPYEAFFQRMDAAEMTALLAPHCATLFMLGDRDAVIDKTHGGAVAVRDLEEAVAGASRILDSAGVAGTIASRIVRGADHRPFFLSADAADFLRNHLDHTPVPIPEGRITFGAWSDAEGVAIESLYATVERERGLEVVEAGVRCRRPEALACFPNQRPPREYTMQGWIDACRKGTPTSPP